MNQEGIQNNELQLLAIPQLMKKHFFIPDYQRGYRWEEKQVFQLLKDLWKYFKVGVKTPIGFYCLQPIVVKECSQETIDTYELEDISALPAYDKDNPEQKGPKNNVWYEVIDGQQRLTTIRILLKFYEAWTFMDCNAFELRYATRPEFSDIFKHIHIDPREKTFTLDDGFKFKNVDVEYVKSCAQNILDWFKNDSLVSTNKLNEIGTFLSNFYMDATKDVSVQVIWYETKEETDARDVFERLNNLKVPLSSSELIRALFLSENAEYRCTLTPLQQALPPSRQAEIAEEDKQKKQSSINAKWDEIEHFFQNDKFWAFITNRDAADYRNRIEILFDFMSEKYVQDDAARKDRLFTYLYFDAEAQKKDLWDLWGDVVKNYDCIRFWFENRDYYHKIGYLIHEKHDNILISLLKYANSNDHKKSEFDHKLNDEIRSTINTRKKFSELSYEDSQNDYKVLKTLLLLYNIELTRVSPKESWFPFDEYKRVEKEDGWTLEHIHAQNSECLDATKRREWRDWISYTIAARESILNPSNEAKQLLKDLREKKAILDEELKPGGVPREKYESIVELFRRDLDLWSEGKAFIVLHQLSNLALLSGSINSGIGKGSFSVKQQYINKCIADGLYVPIATKKVFLKHYYKKNEEAEDEQQERKNQLLNQQLFTWDDKARDAYYDSIQGVLSYYFSADKF